MAVKQIIFIGSDNLVQVDVRDALNGAPITDGSVLLRILEDNGSDINGSPFVLSHIPSQPGTWRGVIAYLFTEELQENKDYKGELIIHSPTGRLKSVTSFRAITKPIE